jgi:hypothetical protein
MSFWCVSVGSGNTHVPTMCTRDSEDASTHENSQREVYSRELLGLLALRPSVHTFLKLFIAVSKIINVFDDSVYEGL